MRITALPAPGEYERMYYRARAAFRVGKRVRWGDAVTGRTWDTWDAFRAEWRRALDRRINARAGITAAGRKEEPLYQLNLMRDARALADLTRRIRVYQFLSPECRARFSDKLSRYDD